MISKPCDTLAVLSLTSGICLTEFDKMHEFCEWIMGHSVWTHEFADRALWGRMRIAVYKQHPELESFVITKDDWKERSAEAVERFGPTIDFKCGDNERTESPMESAARMFPDKPVIAL